MGLTDELSRMLVNKRVTDEPESEEKKAHIIPT